MSEKPDPVTGMTKTEVNLIQESWSLVWSDSRTHGINIFVKFFSELPQYKQKFSSLRDISAAEMATHPRLKAHATTVMNSINSLVDALEYPEELIELLTKIAENHYKRSLQASDFRELFVVIHAYLASALGEHLSPAGAEAWKKVFAVIANVVEKLQNDLEAKENCCFKLERWHLGVGLALVILGGIGHFKRR